LKPCERITREKLLMTSDLLLEYVKEVRPVTLVVPRPFLVTHALGRWPGDLVSL
jgi:hypothetical protein